MQIKKYILILLCFSAVKFFAQTPKSVFDAPSWNPPYLLNLDGWRIERFLIPIEFAPKITYTGVEDLRFTKGWGDSTSEEYWSYAYLWFLNGKVEVNENSIKHNLELYYIGLIERNIEKRKIPSNKVFAPKVKIKKIQTYSGDIKTFKGSIFMLDYMTQQTITLNCLVHYKTCIGQDNTFIFYEISPKPDKSEVWSQLNDLWKTFNCSPTKSN